MEDLARKSSHTHGGRARAFWIFPESTTGSHDDGPRCLVPDVPYPIVVLTSLPSCDALNIRIILTQILNKLLNQSSFLGANLLDSLRVFA